MFNLVSFWVCALLSTSINIQLRKMFPMIVSSGQKMIERIDMQIGTKMKQTINTKEVSTWEQITTCIRTVLPVVECNI